jgi:hypothetical protein
MAATTTRVLRMESFVFVKSRIKGGRDLRRVAPQEVELHVVRHVVVDLRRAGLHRLARQRDAGQGIDVELDRLGRVLRLQVGLGHHARDRVADETHLVGGERFPDGPLHRRAVAHLEVERALVRPVRGQVLRGVDREHARHCPGFLEVYFFQDAMGMCAPDDEGIGLVRLVDVVGVAAFAAQQYGVFEARQRLADQVFHRIPNSSKRR